MSNLNYSKDIIFLLGAGASAEAGMPMVKELTTELKEILHEIPDENGKIRSEFRNLFERIAEVDCQIESNYEQFFNWLILLKETHQSPFNRLLIPKLSILRIAGELSFVIGDGIKKILELRQTNPEYLSQFGNFIPKEGRLKIFTLNYDCCLEDACLSARIDITTGFDPKSKKWNHHLFENSQPGINLYKLHGSLRWFGVIDSKSNQHTYELMELKEEYRKSIPEHFKINKYPDLILGPRTKIQPDDPYITLLYDFHVALRDAKICIIIGYGYKDEHINIMLRNAFDNGLAIFDINPGGPNTEYFCEPKYKNIPRNTKEALTENMIQKGLQSFFAELSEGID